VKKKRQLITTTTKGEGGWGSRWNNTYFSFSQKRRLKLEPL
jgi:hypothetical protein